MLNIDEASIVHFNSIKVRLEPQIGSSGYSAKIFQFHKGAIRTSPFQVPPHHFLNFNSIKVRLEHDIPFLLNHGQIFQFHKGAIRTLQDM